MQKIAVIKTGWSDFVGGAVEGAHSHIQSFQDGHERYNFRPDEDGRFYAYTPPLGASSAAPKPKQLDGWLVFSVARSPARGGLYVTGWYEDATFEGSYVTRPEYGRRRPSLPHADSGEPYAYTLSAPRAVQIDPLTSPHTVPGDHMKRAPIYYLRGNGTSGEWREQLALKLLQLRQRWNKGVERSRVPISRAGSGGVCSDAERRREVEQAAIAAVKGYYSERGFEIVNRQSDNCGFDLLVRQKSGSRAEFHVEVKGTQNASPQFLMSHNEYAYMEANPRTWRLAMVTSALSRTPKVQVMEAKDARAQFTWREFTWQATASRQLMSS